MNGGKVIDRKEKDIYLFARAHGLSERKAVDVSSGICPCGPSKKVKAAIRKAIRDVSLPPDPSLFRLRKTISSKLGVDGNNLIFANSPEELLFLISIAFGPGKIMSAGPLLDIHLSALSSSGAKVEYTGDQSDPEFIAGKKDVGQGMADAGLVFISQPNRMSGRLADNEWLRETLSFCEARNIMSVIDESLIEFTDDHGNCETAASGEGIIVIRSTANFYGLPGLGLAFAVSSAGIIERLKEKMHCEVNTLAAAAARAAVKDRTYLQTARKYVAGEKSFLLHSLKKVGGFTCYDSDSNVMLLGTSHPVEEVSAALARQGFMISILKTAEPPAESIFRMSVMEHEKNVKFLRTLKVFGTKRTPSEGG